MNMEGLSFGEEFPSLDEEGGDGVVTHDAA